VSGYTRVVGVGGIGSGLFLALEGEATLGRTESRPAHVMDVRDSCKLHTVAQHLATLGGLDVVAVGVVGDDDPGRRTTQEMRDAGIDMSNVRVDAERPTLFSVCFQYPDGEGGNVTTADSAASALTVEDVARVAALVDERTIALAQPEVPLEPRRRLLGIGRERGALTAGSFTSLELEEARPIFELLDVVALNEHEAAALTRSGVGDTEPLLRAAASAFRDDARVIVTAGARGAFALERGRCGQRSAPSVDVVSTAGCGDALLAGVLWGLAAGVPLIGDATDPEIDDALGLGVLLASLNATSPHTIAPGADREALRTFAEQHGRTFVGEVL
jgi:sugar/nucleoside kinase (ribokinase family)